MISFHIKGFSHEVWPELFTCPNDGKCFLFLCVVFELWRCKPSACKCDWVKTTIFSFLAEDGTKTLVASIRLHCKFEFPRKVRKLQYWR